MILTQFETSKRLWILKSEKVPEYNRLLTDNVIFQNRTKGIGILSKKKMPLIMGLRSGRVSGYSCDIRKNHPYSA